MIFEDKADYKAIAERNKVINASHCVSSPIPCCGHDFWEAARKAKFGDVLLCTRCNCYYAKIKHKPWIVEETKWLQLEVIGHHTNHLEEKDETRGWYVFVHTRVTN